MTTTNHLFCYGGKLLTMQVMLDTMVVDHIIKGDSKVDVEDLKEAEADISFTYLLREELLGAHDEEEIKGVLRELDTKEVQPESSPYGMNYGGGYSISELCDALISAVRGDDIAEIKDAMVIETALKNGDKFVTQENRLLDPPEKYPESIGSSQIMSEEEFIAWIEGQTK